MSNFYSFQKILFLQDTHREVFHAAIWLNYVRFTRNQEFSSFLFQNVFSFLFF